MRSEETNKGMARIYARKRLATDPAVRAKFDELIEGLRQLIGEPADEAGWHVLATAAQIAADMEDGKFNA